MALSSDISSKFQQIVTPFNLPFQIEFHHAMGISMPTISISINALSPLVSAFSCKYGKFETISFSRFNRCILSPVYYIISNVIILDNRIWNSFSLSLVKKSRIERKKNIIKSKQISLASHVQRNSYICICVFACVSIW